MITFKDKTFCVSPNCKNDCGRKMTEHEKLEAIINDLPVCYGYFCGDLIAGTTFHIDGSENGWIFR